MGNTDRGHAQIRRERELHSRLNLANGDVLERDGHAGGVPSARRRPFESFINSKNLEHYAWTVALTRMISAIFRRGGDVSFVVEELKAVFDPQGGQWMGGHYVPGLLAAIGGVIETHMLRTGFLVPEPRAGEETGLEKKALAAAEPHAGPPSPAEPGLGRRDDLKWCRDPEQARVDGRIAIPLRPCPIAAASSQACPTGHFG